ETATGRSMLVNARGAILGSADRARLLERVQQACAELRPAWVVCSGSVPRGVGEDLYAEIADMAHAPGLRFVVDCDGAQLSSAVAKGCDLIAPNQHEAERLSYLPIRNADEAVKAATSLRSVSAEVYVKLGPEGAVASTRAGTWIARGPQLQSGSAVGAGDAFLAALLVAKEKGAPHEEALRNAVAAGTAVLKSRGSDLLTRSDYDHMLREVQLTQVNGS
ncbi:MAG TPA: PfkB family carbohydrate kinase, partial [Longimicrobiales bacterium]